MSILWQAARQREKKLHCPEKVREICGKFNHFESKCFPATEMIKSLNPQSGHRVSRVQIPAKRNGIFAKMLENGEGIEYA